MGERLCSQQARGRGKGASHSLGEGAGAAFALGLPLGPGPSVPGAGKGVGACAGRDWAFVPSCCPWPGLGKPAGAGLGAGPSTGRMSAWQYQHAQAQAGAWERHCLPSQLLEWRTRGLDLLCNLRPGGLADPPCPHLRKFTPQHHAWLRVPFSFSLVGTEDQVMAGPCLLWLAVSTPAPRFPPHGPL